MAYESTQVKEVVERAVGHQWSIPEFQRGFVWKPTQVRDLAESLWLNYPIGSLLVWNSQGPTEERIARDAQRPSLWVVDGQQRATALSILFGRKPYWWPSADEWDKTLKRYDIRFDVHTKEPPFFLVANAGIRKAKSDRYLSLSRLLTLDTERAADQQTLMQLAKDIKVQGFCDGLDAMEDYARLDRVRKTRDKEVVTITIDQELEEVVEIFSRLNSKGTRVTEADIYLGIVAARAPGWVRDSFLPFLRDLAQAGFDLNPNLLFRCLTGIGAGKVRFKDVADDFWDAACIQPAWEKTKKAWSGLISRFRTVGVLSNDPMPTEAALVTLIALQHRFPDEPFEPCHYWFLQASRFARYSGSGTTSIDEDLRDVNEATSAADAVHRLTKRFPHDTPLEAEDFLRDYSDTRFGRFLLYLLAYDRQAVDWDSAGHRIGFDGSNVLADFRPQWHHVFPRKYLEGKAPEERINALANIAVIGPAINIRISDKDPMAYIQKYGITAEKLRQQFIESDITITPAAGYEQWLIQRADRLAKAGNDYLEKFRP